MAGTSPFQLLSVYLFVYSSSPSSSSSCTKGNWNFCWNSVQELQAQQKHCPSETKIPAPLTRVEDKEKLGRIKFPISLHIFLAKIFSFIDGENPHRNPNLDFNMNHYSLLPLIENPLKFLFITWPIKLPPKMSSTQLYTCIEIDLNPNSPHLNFPCSPLHLEERSEKQLLIWLGGFVVIGCLGLLLA